jgi:16S rRNA (uracil1498-N3)-methyltransferase
MREERYFYVPHANVLGELPEDEAIHALRVLRLAEGDEMMLIDGEGTFYRAVLISAKGRRCFYEVKESFPQQPQWSCHLHLAIAPTKMMERMEWLVEKATEVGFDELSLLNCHFSERRVLKTRRLERIAVSAMKQSRKAWKPVINEMQDFKLFVATHSTGLRFIAHCYDEIPRVNLYEELMKASQRYPQKPSEDIHAPIVEKPSVDFYAPLSNEPSKNVTVLIGPEGDFSIDEVRNAVDSGFVSVDLGKSRLRTETAGLAAIMMMQLSCR